MSKYNINYGIDLKQLIPIKRIKGNILMLFKLVGLLFCSHAFTLKKVEKFVGMRAYDQKSNHSHITKNTFSEFKNNKGEDIKYHSLMQKRPYS